MRHHGPGAWHREVTVVAVEPCVPSLDVHVRRYLRARKARGLKPKPYVGSLRPTPLMSPKILDGYLDSGQTLILFKFVTMPQHSEMSRVELTLNETPISVDIGGQVLPLNERVALLSAVSMEIYNRYALLNACPGRINLVVMKLSRNYKRTKDLSFLPEMTRVIDPSLEGEMLR